MLCAGLNTSSQCKRYLYLFRYSRVTWNLIGATLQLQHRIFMQQLGQQKNTTLYTHTYTCWIRPVTVLVLVWFWLNMTNMLFIKHINSLESLNSAGKCIGQKTSQYLCVETDISWAESNHNTGPIRPTGRTPKHIMSTYITFWGG